MSRVDTFRARVREAVAVCEALIDDAELSRIVDAVVGEMVSCLKSGGKVLLCGNGGSSSDAQHLAAELVGRFTLDRRPYPALALTENSAAVTAIGNDYSFADIFARQVVGFGCPGDVLIGLSTSGHSENVIAALRVGRERDLVTVAFVGAPGSPMAETSRYAVHVDGPSTARIQEGHMLLAHAIFEIVERELCGQ